MSDARVGQEALADVMQRVHACDVKVAARADALLFQSYALFRATSRLRIDEESVDDTLLNDLLSSLQGLNETVYRVSDLSLAFNPFFPQALITGLIRQAISQASDLAGTIVVMATSLKIATSPFQTAASAWFDEVKKLDEAIAQCESVAKELTSTGVSAHVEVNAIMTLVGEVARVSNDRFDWLPELQAVLGRLQERVDEAGR